MAYFLSKFHRLILFLLFASMPALWSAEAAMDPRFEIDPKSLGASLPPKKGASEKERRTSRAHSERKQPVAAPSSGTTHIVRQGDNLFKILIRDYGLSSEEAELFIEDIRRENNIYDIKRLKIGQKIIIPPVKRKADGTLNVVLSKNVRKEAGSSSGVTFTLDASAPAMSDQDVLSHLKTTWDSIIPQNNEHQKPLAIQSSAFSLSLDPRRYPVFTAIDGGRILVDQAGSIPPLVRSLIQEKEPSIRIVSESPANRKQFMAAMLGAGGFYSVEENFSMEFGVDPKLTVRAEFKVEKSAESISRHELLLVNSGRSSTPPILDAFLKKEGFALLEPFASPKPAITRPGRTVSQITAKGQPEIVDALLSSLSVSPQHDRRLDVFAADNNGISLSVKAERSFERKGQKYVITRFDGDPVTYTLFRILETKGYKVVVLEPQDTFRKITEKITNRMGLSASYAQHNLIEEESGAYMLQVSGFRLDDALFPGGSVFLTNLEFDRVVRDLLTDYGYSITAK